MVGALVVFQRPSVPLVPLAVHAVSLPEKKDVAAIDLNKIYQNDPFRTSMSAPKQPEVPILPVLPMPPQKQEVTMPAQEIVNFLPPLPLTLKGTIAMGSEAGCRAIIANTKTGAQDLYRVGDTVEDAEIIYIGSSKITLVRSNGQQETMFITKEDADQEVTLKNPAWDTIVHKVDQFSYQIDPLLFKKYIPNLAEFLDALDVVTAFDRGVSIGCQVGAIKPNSIGVYLGLEKNDIITRINNIPTTSTNQRVTIFNTIKELPVGSRITATVIRNSSEIVFTYELSRFADDHKKIMAAPEKTDIKGAAPAEDPTIEHTSIIKEPGSEPRRLGTQKLAAEAQEPHTSLETLAKKDEAAMSHLGGRNAALKRNSNRKPISP